ncbi:alkaline phosphatase D family protein [Sphingomonas crocodyli]|uniref:alkaline phosphatase D family protein n=1 Tax=Sphingomonas crocodyli TaxID=1979270 RepID=UPI001F0C02AE|nr:alkaline phosphatase D family protein [Sphingomonas crocodyli]
MIRVDRRSALGLLGAGVALPVGAARAASAAKISFDHGVASGDPTATSAILWTRATPADPAHSAPVPLKWSIAERADGPAIRSGTVEARPARDFTAKVDAKGLKAGTEYHYWFEAADGTRSPVGRVRTLAQGKIADAVLAVVTCQLYPGGLFNAYDAVSKLDRVDAIVHLGDYIYEYGPDGYGGGTGKKLGRNHEPPHEIVTLADYRTRHAQYKRDPDLQAAHARAAFICVWDDHEVANDGWVGGAENHQPETEGEWKKRKAAALQAYFEWMPIRDAAPGKPWDAINRSFQFGDVATLLMVETRLLARSQQVDDDGRLPSAETFAARLADLKRPEREMLGAPQQSWITDTLTASVKAGTPWQVIGNQVVMARVNGPKLPAAQAGPLLGALPDYIRKQVEVSMASFAAGLPFNLDAWDGYPAARERLYASFRKAESRPIVLSGDSHAFWVNDLQDAEGRLVAAEFGTSSITSPSQGDMLPQLPLGQMLMQSSPEVAFCDQKAKGYIVLTLTHDRASADYVAVSTIMAKPYDTKSIGTFDVTATTREKIVRRG